MTDTPRRTVKEVVPLEAMDEDHVRKIKDVEILEVIDSGYGWPSIHKNITVWWKLANGKALGWNENVNRGWTFPLVSLNPKKRTKRHVRR